MTLRSHSIHLVLYLLSFSAGATALSSNVKRPAKRVAIIGTGIAGLSVAHALTNSPLLEEEYGSFNFEVSMFEARKKLDTKAGAGVQLNGGLAALGKINGEVQRAVLDAGLPVSQIISCSKPWSSSKPFEVLLQLDIGDIVKKAGGEVSQSLIQDGEVLWSAIMRGCLQDTLWKTLPSVTRRGVKFNKDLIDIQPRSDGSAMCEFSDGTTAGPFDLVVGSDGIKSACKEYIKTGKISVDPSNRQGKAAALYSGIRIKYAVDDKWTPKDGQSKSAVLKQYFGDGANVLDGTYGNGKGRQSKIAFFVFLDKDYRGPFRRRKAVESAAVPDENIDWREGERRNHEFARKAMSNGVQEFNIPLIDVDPTVKAADRFFELGVYFHNPFSLEGWSKKVAGKDSAVVALCGDAAVRYTHPHVYV
jgi:2-polyprenyl-6-methoxyphenol hydroxylase-like FAD-dependent oxidoreductase